jgi:hypothetical protein
MTHVSDHIQVGSAGISPDTRSVPGILNTTPPSGPGVGTQAIKFYTITPVTSTTTALGAAQTVNAANFAITPGVGVTTTSVNGVAGYAIDVPRAITLVGDTGTLGTNITIQGWDVYQVPVTQTVSGPSGNTTVTTAKTFAYVKSVAAAGNTTSGVSIGVADVFGFPVAVSTFGQLVLNWNNAVVTSSAGWTAPVTTNPATALTGDVRGKYAVQTAADGVKILTAFIGLTNAITNTTDSAYGIQQFSL